MAPGQKHREALIESSMALFRRQGFAATGLAEILSESGAPKGSLYHYFPLGKESLAVAAISRAGEGFAAALRARHEAGQNAADVIRMYGEISARGLQASGFREGCPIATIALEAAPGSAAVTQATKAAFAAWSDGLAVLLCDAGLAERRAAELADFVISTFEGALILARVRQSTAPLLNAVNELALLVERDVQDARSTNHA